MSENKYQFKGTQESWEFDERFIQAYNACDKQIRICEVYHPIHDIGYHSPKQASANAHLIAAAPELLQACIKALEYLPSLKSLPKTTETQIGNDTKFIINAIHKALNIQE